MRYGVRDCTRDESNGDSSQCSRTETLSALQKALTMRIINRRDLMLYFLRYYNAVAYLWNKIFIIYKRFKIFIRSRKNVIYLYTYTQI